MYFTEIGFISHSFSSIFIQCTRFVRVNIFAGRGYGSSKEFSSNMCCGRQILTRPVAYYAGNLLSFMINTRSVTKRRR